MPHQTIRAGWKQTLAPCSLQSEDGWPVAPLGMSVLYMACCMIAQPPGTHDTGPVKQAPVKQAGLPSPLH